MQRFDRYVLSQLLMLFGFFALVLVAVYWLNRAMGLFDRLIADGHSTRIFFEFSILTLPTVVAVVLPMASFAAAIYVTNRLRTESELVVVQAMGFSPARLSRPVLVFGLIVAALVSVLVHVLVPVSQERLHEREIDISASVSARLLREGAFVHPADGVTFYIRSISEDGALSDVMLSDRREADSERIYTAAEAYLTRDAEGPKMVMLSGVAQTLDTESRRLSTTNFSDLVFDISELVEPARRKREVHFLPTWQLLTEAGAVAESTGDSLAEIRYAAHQRIQTTLQIVATALLGYAALIGGSHSRFGVTGRIVAVVVAALVIRVAEGAVAAPAQREAGLWWLVHLPTLAAFALAAGLIAQASRPRRAPRRAAGTTPPGTEAPA